MNIHKIHIDAFGKLFDFEMTFTDGLNCVIRENEFGKSTILAFIRAMFYDFPSRSKKNDLKDFSRQKYMPWGERASGGRIVFSFDGTTYLLVRRFLARKSEDKTTLSEADTGRKVDFGTEEIGVFLFGLSEAEFVNTIFIGQLSSDFALTGRATEDLSQRLANLAATGSEIYSFEVAEKNIKTAIADLQNTRGGGKIPQVKKALEAIEEQEDQLEQMSAYIDLYNEEIKALDVQISEINTTQIRGIAEKRKKTDDERAQLLQKNKDLERAIIEIQEKEKNISVTQDADKKRMLESLKTVDNEISMIDKEKNQINQDAQDRDLEIQSKSENIQDQRKALQEEMSQIDVAQRAFSVKLDHLRDQKKNLGQEGTRVVKNHRYFYLLVAVTCSLICFFAGISFLLSQQRGWLFFFFAAIPAVSGWIGFVTLHGRAKKRWIQKIEQADAQIEKIRDAVVQKSNEKNYKLSEDGRLQMMQDHQNLIKKEEDNRLKQNLSRIKMRLDALDKQRKAIIEQIEHIDNSARTRTEMDIAQESNKSKETLLAQKEELDKQIMIQEKEENTLDQHEKELMNQISLIQQEIAKRQGQIEQILYNMPVQSELEQQKDQYEEKRILYTKHFDALKVAHEAMREAAKEMERLFAPQVSARAADYLKQLTGGKYSTIRLDKDFNIEVDVREAMDYQDADYFSGATMDQIYLALRLSISDLILSNQGPLPFFLDDALTQYDENRLRDAAKLLRDISASRQVILFTCHAHIYDCITSYSEKA